MFFFSVFLILLVSAPGAKTQEYDGVMGTASHRVVG